MENIPLLCDLAAAIALIEEWVFFQNLASQIIPSLPLSKHI